MELEETRNKIRQMIPGRYGVSVKYKQLLPVSKRYLKKNPNTYDETKCYRIVTRQCVGTVPYTHQGIVKKEIAQGYQVQENKIWENSKDPKDKNIIVYNKNNGEPGIKLTPKKFGTTENGMAIFGKDIVEYYINDQKTTKEEIQRLMSDGVLNAGADKDQPSEREIEFIPYLKTIIELNISENHSNGMNKEEENIGEGLKEGMKNYSNMPAMTWDNEDIVYPEDKIIEEGISEEYIEIPEDQIENIAEIISIRMGASTFAESIIKILIKEIGAKKLEEILNKMIEEDPYAEEGVKTELAPYPDDEELYDEFDDEFDM